MNEDTLEVPLPEGVEPSPDFTTTQELPVVTPFPEIRLVTPVSVNLPSDTRTVRVETLPAHLLGDPILTTPAPVADETPLFDQIYGKPPAKPEERRPRRKLVMADRVLIGMGATALVMGVGVYGMVVNGWGGGSIPEEKAASAPRTPSQSPEETTEPDEPLRPTTGPQKTSEPRRTAVPVSAPQTYVPVPEKSITVVSPAPEPEPSREPVAGEEPEPPAPEPTREEPVPEPELTTPGPVPTPTVTPTPTLSVSVPPVTNSASAPMTPTEEPSA